MHIAGKSKCFARALHCICVCVRVCVFTIYVILPQRRSFTRTHGFGLLQFACT